MSAQQHLEIKNLIFKASKSDPVSFLNSQNKSRISFKCDDQVLPNFDKKDCKSNSMFYQNIYCHKTVKILKYK